MLFSSTIFLFVFLPITLWISFILPTIRLKNIFLLIASLLFYAWGEGELVFLMLFSILLNYIFGLAIDKASSPIKKKTFLTLAIIGNLALLGYYKYINFFIDNLNTIFSNIGTSTITYPKVALPIGISFFTFQAISYVADVYRNDGKVQKDPLNLALYITLFPQLIAGPIIRYHDVFQQITHRITTKDKFAEGIKRFVLGLGKKVLIANTCARVTDQIFELSEHDLSGSVAWLGIICFSVQVYFDFSGYSDMAIGLGKMFGFDFLENFNYPMISKSIKEMWTRWHISLSTWFRDYVYIPLGGNKKGNIRTYINLISIFFLTGFWHGASWNFIIWGMIHGFFMLIERIGLEKKLQQIPSFFSHFYMLFIFVVSLVFFRSDDIPSTITYFSKMFGFSGADNSIYSFSLFFEKEVIIVLILAIFASIPKFDFLNSKTAIQLNTHPILLHLNNIILLGIFSLCVMSIMSGTHNPFIYFRF